MAKSATGEIPQGSLLEPMNLHNTIEYDEMLRQRITCGWDCSPSDLDRWRESADARTISQFWVVPASLSQLPAPQRYSGHIAMIIKKEPPEYEPVLHIFNLYISPEHRRSGLGRAAVQALEAWAKIEPYGSPDCKALSLSAISRRYIEDDADEWRGFYKKVCESLGIEVPAKGTGNEDWYSRMGFVTYDEKPMYPVTVEGKDVLLVAALMRKELA